MRAAFAAHFDVVVVIWALALAVGWSVFAVSRSQTTNEQWSSPPQAAPAWVVTGN
jgi:hypothetical protein